MDKCLAIFFTLFISLGCGEIFVVHQFESQFNPQSWQGAVFAVGSMLGIVVCLFIAIIAAAYISTEIEYRRLYPSRQKFQPIFPRSGVAPHPQNLKRR